MSLKFVEEGNGLWEILAGDVIADFTSGGKAILIFSTVAIGDLLLLRIS